MHYFVVVRLRHAVPGPQAEHPLHRIQRRLDEIVEIPSIIGRLRLGCPELDSDGKGAWSAVKTLAGSRMRWRKSVRGSHLSRGRSPS